MVAPRTITSPDDPALDELCDELARLAGQMDADNSWPAEQLELCGRMGVYQWFLSPEVGGQGWDEADIVRGYLRLSAACLTTTFIITQRTGACRRIAAADNEPLKQELLPDLVSGDSFATVGISHLTTSRQHLKKPVLRAEETEDGFRLDGFSPWVTGGVHAQTVVIGATLDDGRQVLLALPMNLPGIQAAEPARLTGVSSSHTGAVNCQSVEVPRHYLLAGPTENVMQQGLGANTGGLQTSTLAIGLADGAITFVEKESQQREDLQVPVEQLRRDHRTLENELLQAAVGNPACTVEQLRVRANSLALRASQAALAAAKGTGYVLGHPAGRWCRESLFFLVWSCPQAVMNANLCELAGIQE